LDQFLEHLDQVCVERIIRIGGQSKSTTLEGKNLREVSEGESKTKHENYHLAMTYKALEDQDKAISKALRLIHGIYK